MSDTIRTIDEHGVNLTVRVLPEIRSKVYDEADRRARSHPGATGGEKRSGGSYLGAVALIHFLRLAPEERRAIYEEVRGFMDQRCRVEEESPLVLPPYRVATEEARPEPTRATGEGTTTAWPSDHHHGPPRPRRKSKGA